ncbi:MAG: HupE/UreJ family protein [Luteolibacter sp.]
MKYILPLILWIGFFGTAFQAKAHQVDSVEMEFLQTDGDWKLEGLLDIAYMLPEKRGVEGAPPLFRDDVMAAPPTQHERVKRVAEETMRKLLELKFNGKTVPWEIRFPDFDKEPLVLPEETGGWALMRAEITTPIPLEAGKLEAFWHDDLQSELIVIIEEMDNIGLLSISTGMSDVLVESEGGPEPKAVTPGTFTLTKSWMISGYKHVIPWGIDHLLFILGLFLLAPRWKPLLTQSLLFTIAHSVTLALTLFGLITLPSKLIEILIAASIAWIGIENLFFRELKPHRIAVVFAFGLLHGMGFASVLHEKTGDLTGKQLALPLVGFNVGVELAQISVLAIAFLLLIPAKKWTGKIQVCGSIFIALAGIFWVFERILS